MLDNRNGEDKVKIVGRQGFKILPDQAANEMDARAARMFLNDLVRIKVSVVADPVFNAQITATVGEKRMEPRAYFHDPGGAESLKVFQNIVIT
jgi:ribosomal protein S3